MNYYEHHIGDYAEATAHLSFVEDAAYSRLIRKYYATEKPIPVDLKAAQRLVGARTREERAAVESVLEEFFEPTEDGWRHRRCDREIERFLESEPDREAKRENERERQRRTRERRKQLFDALREHGIVPAYDTPMSQLQALASQLQSRPVTHDDKPVTRDDAPPVTRDATATQTPDTTPHSPDSKPNTEDTRSAQPTDPPPDEQPDRRVSMAGAVCFAMRAEGIGHCNPGHPDLQTLIDQGAEVQNFVSAARAAVDKGKGFAYALGTVRGQLAEARKLAAAGRTAAPRNGNSGSAARAARMAEACPTLVNGHTAADFIDAEALDVTPRRVG